MSADPTTTANRRPDPSATAAATARSGSGSPRPVGPLRRLLDPSARPFLLVALAALALAGAIPADPKPMAISGLIASTLITAVAVPCILRVFRPGRWIVAAALVAMAVPLAMETTNNLTNDSIHPRLRYHDGGVLATRAAARDVVEGRNPYGASFEDDIPDYWNPLWTRGDVVAVNPLVDHYPYLPGAFLVQIPFLKGADVLGLDWDPRFIGVGLLVVTALVVATRREAPWARASMILVLGSAFPVAYGSWGRNDVIPGCLVVLTALLADHRPRLAGLLFGLAVSFKFLVLVAVPPLVWWIAKRRGVGELRRWWTAPALLAATCVPFLVADPRAFVDDTLLFNLGLTDLVYPTSGMGLPVAAPGVFHGPVLALASVACEVVALALPLLLVRRMHRAAAIPFAAALGTWFLIWPSRTFQSGYLTLIVVLASTGWLLLGDATDDADADADAANEADDHGRSAADRQVVVDT